MSEHEQPAEQQPQPPAAAGGEEDTGRRRLRQALLHPGRSQVVVAVLLAVVAFAAIVQVQTAEDDDTYAGYREQDLVNVLSGLAGASRRARAEITRLEEARDELVSDTNAERVALQQATNEADTLSVLAGLVPVTGPGIRITITEVTGRVRADTMLNMVQGLRIASAEAMQLNGQVRLVAESSFTSAEGGLVVDGELLSAEDGAEVEVTTLASLDIESVRAAVEPEYAQPEDAQ